MGISPTDLERALDSLNELALPALGAICLYQMLRRGVGGLVFSPVTPLRRPSDPSRLVRRALSALGLVVGIASPVAASDRPLPRRTKTYSVEISSLRSEPGRFPPPRLPGPAEPPGDRGEAGAPPWTSPAPDERAAGSHAGGAHPAVHGGGSRNGARLFERSSGRAPAAVTDRPRVAPREGWHAVLPGDTLWSIAARRLDTEDVRRIARYWPRIHRANRDEIGPNPNLIRPGQVLELPPETA